MPQTNGGATRYFKVFGLVAPGEECLPTALRDDILLSSWLITLIRTREDRCASFEWAYDVFGEKRSVRTLSTDEILPGLKLDTSIGSVAESVDLHLSTLPRCCTATACPDSLLLSTGSLSPHSEETVGEVSFLLPGSPASQVTKLNMALQGHNTSRDTPGRWPSRDLPSVAQQGSLAIYREETYRDSI